MKEFIEIPFGARDSETLGWEYNIPEGYTASIENGKIVVKKEESKDEKIRKEIIVYLSTVDDKELIPYESWIAWLEKQKGTDEEIIFRPTAGTDIRIATEQALKKIDIGKKVVLAFNGAYIPVNGKTVGEIDSEYDKWLEKQIRYKSPDEVLKIRQEIYQSGYDDGYKHGCEDTKKQGEFKPVWSEEDENRLKNLYDVIDKCDWNTASKEGFKKFLKSLKPQNKWKPSDEQMEALKDAIDYSALHGSPHWNDFIFNELVSLRRDLKKLTEE